MKIIKTYIVNKIENLTGYGICLVLLLSPFIFDSSLFDFSLLPKKVFIQLIIFFLLLSWSLRLFINRTAESADNAVSWIITAFIGWAFLSLFWSLNVYEGILRLIHLAACASVFFLITETAFNKTRIIKILTSVMIAGAFAALLGCLQFFFSLDFIPQTVPPAAAFGNRNVASQFISMTLPISLAFLFSARNRWIVLINILICLIYLAVSQTRAGWLAVFAEAAVISCLFLFNENRDRLNLFFRKFAYVFIISSALFMIVSIFNPGLFKFFIPAAKKILLHEVSVSRNGTEQRIYKDSMAGRLEWWRNALQMIKDRPFSGVGLGNFKIFYPVYHQSSSADRNFSEDTQLRYAHNDYIQISGELGIPGLFLFLMLCIMPFIMAFKILSSRPCPEKRFTVIALTGGISAFLVHAVFSFPVQCALPLLLFFTYLAVLTVFWNAEMERSETKRNFRTSGLLPKFRFASFWHSFCCALPLVCLAAIIMLGRFHYGNILSDRYYRLAWEKEQEEKWPEAVKYGLMSCGYNQYNAAAMSALGRAYLGTGDFLKGIETLEKVLKLNPYNINAMMNLGLAYFESGERQRAVEILSRVLDIKPDYPKALANMGIIYLKTGDIDRALQCFEKAVEYDENNAEFHISLASLMAEKKRYSDAVREYEQVLRLRPDMDFAHKNISIICYKYLQEYEKAFEHMRAYIKMKPEAPASRHFQRMLSEIER